MTAFDASGESLEHPTPSPAREKGRRQTAGLIVLFYVLLIFEGALRKWVLTSYGQLLFFIRDPVVVAIYALALRYSFFPRSNLLTAGIVFGLLGLLLIALQAIGVASSIDKWPVLAAYGWRNYFLYLPLPFVVGEVFDRADLQRVIKLTLLLTLPIAFLVLLQFRSSPDAPVNVGFGTSTEQQFHGLTVDAEHTRPTGPFTSDVGEKEFVASSIAMLMALWIASPALRFVKPWQLLVATGAALACLAVSGSRGAMLQSGTIAIAAVIAAAVVRQPGASARAMLPIVIAAVAIVLYPIVFPEGYSTFMNRWSAAAATETQTFKWGVFGRALYGFVDFFGLMGDTPVIGYGLGLAGNASITLGVTIPGFTGWAESDWARHIVDLGPLIGVAFIAYRIAFVIWLGATCMAGARRLGDPLPLLLFAFVGLDLLYGQVTGHGTVNGYVWLFCGLCIAAARPQARLVPALSPPDAASASLRPFPNLLR